MSISLLIFDLDGTLVDSCEDLTNALNYCLQIRGFSTFSTNEVKNMVGEGVQKLIEKVIEKKGMTKEIFSELKDCFIKYYSEHIADFSKPYQGVEDTLKSLKDINKAVLSNKITDLTIKTLKALDLLKYFQFVAGNDFFSEQKPSRLPILKIMERFNAKSENTLIIGDSDIDIKAGKEAGIKTVAVTYGYREREFLKDADFIIDKISDLMQIIRTFSK